MTEHQIIEYLKEKQMVFDVKCSGSTYVPILYDDGEMIFMGTFDLWRTALEFLMIHANIYFDLQGETNEQKNSDVPVGS